MAHFRPAQCEGQRRSWKGEGEIIFRLLGGWEWESQAGRAVGEALTSLSLTSSAPQKQVWGAGTWTATGHLEAYTLLPRDTPCSGGSQLSFRTPEITGASWLSGFVISLMGTLKLKTKCSLWPGCHKVAPECQGLHPSCQNRFLWSGIPDMDKRLRVKREHLTEPSPTGQSQGGHGGWQCLMSRNTVHCSVCPVPFLTPRPTPTCLSHRQREAVFSC